MAGDGSSIWMIVAPAGRQPFDLGAEDRHERLRGGIALRVDLARPVGQPAGQRVRPGQRHLERPGAALRRVAVLGDDAETVGSGDRFEHLEAVLLVVPACAQTAVGRECPDAGQVRVELGGEEAGPSHLAVADDVDAGRLLVVQGKVDRVVEHLLEVGGSELATLRSGDPGDEP